MTREVKNILKHVTVSLLNKLQYSLCKNNSTIMQGCNNKVFSTNCLWQKSTDKITINIIHSYFLHFSKA